MEVILSNSKSGTLRNNETEEYNAYNILEVRSSPDIKTQTDNWLISTLKESISIAASLNINDIDVFKAIHSNNEHSHWDWSRKLATQDPDFEFTVFSLDVKGESQALMMIKYPHQSSINRNKIVYVDYLQVAPWNLKNAYRELKRYRGLGVLMLEFASNFKAQLEHDYNTGLGLHSLPQSEGFYNAIGCTELGQDKDYYNLKYFEYKVAQ